MRFRLPQVSGGGRSHCCCPEETSCSVKINKISLMLPSIAINVLLRRCCFTSDLLCRLRSATCLKKQIIICQPLHTIHTTHTPPSSSPVCTASRCFAQQQLYIWQFLKALSTDGYVTLAALQLLCRGHRHAVQSAQPERSKVT